MTSDVVVDSCVIAKWFFKEPDSHIADQLFQDVIGAGSKLLALDMAVVEVANVIWKNQYRGLMSAADAERRICELRPIPLQLQPTSELLEQGLQIAIRYRRSIYDALFVALAKAQSLTGVTSDEPLYHAVHADYPQIILLRNWAVAPKQ